MTDILAPTPASQASTLRSDRRAGALLAQRRPGATAGDPVSRTPQGRLAARGAVTAVRSGGRLVVLPTRATA